MFRHSAHCAWLVVTMLSVGPLMGQPAQGETTERIAKGFDGKPFHYTRKLLREQGAHRVFALSYPSPMITEHESNNTIPAEYYQPRGIKEGEPPRPGVVCLHILNGNFELVRLLCSVLADRGVPAMMFKLPYYGERRPPQGKRMLLRDPRLFAEAMGQGMLDIRRSLDVLQSLPEVDESKLGLCGISLGAILGASAAGYDPRIQREVLVLGGGDLQHILYTANETRAMATFYNKLSAEEKVVVDKMLGRIEPLNHAPALRKLGESGRVLMINAEEDRVVAPECTRKLARAMGMEKDVVWLKGLGHYTAMAALPDIIARLVPFFALDMPPGVKPPEVPRQLALAPITVLSTLLQQLGGVVAFPPAPGHCHFIHLELEVKLADGKTHRGFAEYIRGTGRQFRLRATVPEIGKVALGCGEWPWLMATKGTLFMGTLEPDSALGPGTFMEVRNTVKIRVVAGALGALALSPDAFAQYVTVSDGPKTEDGLRSIAIKLHHKHTKGTGTLILAANGRTPKHLTFQSNGASGTITFRQWRYNTLANPELFDPPEHQAEKPVLQRDLFRMFGGGFNFLMEKAQ